ncbi:MAG TPA: MlaD family protein [Planctomycetota bacterium]|nr:MlaD family protein [Planctomycetota bacterium]
MAGMSAFKNVVVGLVFLGSLAVLGIASLWVKKVPFFTRVEALEIRFPSVDNLQEGDNVLVNGLQIGEVDDIRYEPDTNPLAPIVVRVSLPKEFLDRLDKHQAKYTIHSVSPLGGRYLRIVPPPPEAQPRAAGEAVPVGEASPDLMETVALTIAEVRDVFTAIKESRGTLGSLVNDEAVRDAFASAVMDLRDMVAGLKTDLGSEEGTIGYLLKSKEGRERLEKGIEDLTEVVASLKEDLTGEKGIIGFLLKNEEAKDNLRLAIEEIRQFVQDARTGNGLAARLLNDEQLARDAQELIADFHDIVHKTNTGQGTLGQLINNQRAWDELVRVLVLARETVEDLREQAPVSTFVNAIFATF